MVWDSPRPCFLYGSVPSCPAIAGLHVLASRPQVGSAGPGRARPCGAPWRVKWALLLSLCEPAHWSPISSRGKKTERKCQVVYLPCLKLASVCTHDDTQILVSGLPLPVTVSSPPPPFPPLPPLFPAPAPSRGSWSGLTHNMLQLMQGGVSALTPVPSPPRRTRRPRRPRRPGRSIPNARLVAVPTKINVEWRPQVLLTFDHPKLTKKIRN